MMIALLLFVSNMYSDTKQVFLLRQGRTNISVLKWDKLRILYTNVPRDLQKDLGCTMCVIHNELLKLCQGFDKHLISKQFWCDITIFCGKND